jgi:Holliday junction resolvase RusA-like endonuclease
MEDREITFEVPGQPVPQPRPRVSTRGGFGRAYTPKGHAIHGFREAIQLVAKATAWAAGPTSDPVGVEVDCYFQRPPSHLARNGEPKATAPLIPPKSDVDNLAKGILDAITDSGAFWRDDQQVVELIVRKRYARPGSGGRTIVTVRRLPP